MYICVYIYTHIGLTRRFVVRGVEAQLAFLSSVSALLLLKFIYTVYEPVLARRSFAPSCKVSTLSLPYCMNPYYYHRYHYCSLFMLFTNL